MAEEKEGGSFSHLSADLAPNPNAPSVDDLLEEPIAPSAPPHSSGPPPLPPADPPELEDVVPLLGISDQPTQIVRAHKALDRARAKRKERLDEGRTFVVDRDRPPPKPPGKGALWWGLVALSLLGILGVGALVVERVLQDDLMEEAIADESSSGDEIIEEALPIEEPPPPRPAPVEKPIEPVIEQPVEEPKPQQPPPVQKTIAVQKTKAPVRVKQVKEPAPIPEPQPKSVELEKIEQPAPSLEDQKPVTDGKSFLKLTGTIGALVEIDSRSYGALPLDKIELPAGRHAIWVTLAGYQVWQKDHLFKKGETVSLDVKLTPIPPP